MAVFTDVALYTVIGGNHGMTCNSMDGFSRLSLQTQGAYEARPSNNQGRSGGNVVTGVRWQSQQYVERGTGASLVREQLVRTLEAG